MLQALQGDGSINGKDKAKTYHEIKIGKTIYWATGVYRGEVDPAKTLEDLIIRKIIRHVNNTSLDCQV